MKLSSDAYLALLNTEYISGSWLAVMGFLGVTEEGNPAYISFGEKVGNLHVVPQDPELASEVLVNLLGVSLLNYDETELKLAFVDRNEAVGKWFRAVTPTRSYLANDLQALQDLRNEVAFRKRIFKQLRVQNLLEYYKSPHVDLDEETLIRIFVVVSSETLDSDRDGLLGFIFDHGAAYGIHMIIVGPTQESFTADLVTVIKKGSYLRSTEWDTPIYPCSSNREELTELLNIYA